MLHSMPPQCYNQQPLSISVFYSVYVKAVHNHMNHCIVTTKRKHNFQSEISHGSEWMNNTFISSWGEIEVKCRAEIKIVLGHANWNMTDPSRAS